MPAASGCEPCSRNGRRCAAGGGSATTLYAPLVFGQYNGWTSQIAVQNLDAQPAKVGVSYTATANGAVSSEQEVTIPPFSSRVFNPGGAAMLPQGENCKHG